MRMLPILGLACVLLLCSCNTRERNLVAAGNALVARIDSFHEARHRLPENLGELGMEEKMEGPLYYQKLSSDHYMVHFGTTLGESMIYRSTTRSWDDH